jgi:hypothetical protein
MGESAFEGDSRGVPRRVAGFVFFLRAISVEILRVAGGGGGDVSVRIVAEHHDELRDGGGRVDDDVDRVDPRASALTVLELLDFDGPSHLQELEVRANANLVGERLLDTRLHRSREPFDVQFDAVPHSEGRHGPIVVFRIVGLVCKSHFGLAEKGRDTLGRYVPEAPQHLGAPGVDGRKLYAKLATVRAFGAPSHASLDKDFVPFVLEATDQRLADFRQVAGAEMHPAPAHVRAFPLERGELRTRFADVDEGGELDALYLWIPAIFGCIHGKSCP